MPLVMSNALADAIFWVAVASCTVAQVAILRSIFNTAPQGAPAAAPGAPRIHRAMEIVWAILPAVALAGVLALTWRAMQSERAQNAAHPAHAGQVTPHSSHSGPASGLAPVGPPTPAGHLSP
jgi:heme/copper-type cytochrome/quinol oxidase subunit 2